MTDLCSLTNSNNKPKHRFDETLNRFIEFLFIHFVKNKNADKERGKQEKGRNKEEEEKENNGYC